MKRPRMTIALWMAAVVLLALDCGVPNTIQILEAKDNHLTIGQKVFARMAICGALPMANLMALVAAVAKRPMGWAVSGFLAVGGLLLWVLLVGSALDPLGFFSGLHETFDRGSFIRAGSPTKRAFREIWWISYVSLLVVLMTGQVIIALVAAWWVQATLGDARSSAPKPDPLG